MARSHLTREEALASLAKYQTEHPGQTHIRKAYTALGDDTSLSRFVKIKDAVKKPKGYRNRPLPGFANPSIEAGRSIFHRKGVKPVAEFKNLLVSGHNNVKIGNDVRAGKLFRSYKIFTLSLEERATCPSSCHHWQTCYGNNMPYTNRVDHRDQDVLENALAIEIDAKLAKRGTVGILIRLHALGDFFNRDYVWFWRSMLRTYPNLAIFGYTAHSPLSEIGIEIAKAKRFYGRRFAIRWSNGKAPIDCALPIMREDACPPGAFVCPEQTGKRECCATCGACWNSITNVAFLEH